MSNTPVKRVAVVIAAALAVWAPRGRRSRRTRSACPPPTSRNPGAAINAVPGSRAQGWLAQGRSEVLARHGIVATSDPLAAQAGLDIMRQGGNAIDAAVATGAVLDVTSQNDTGIGGDLFALVWSPRTRSSTRSTPPAGRPPAGRPSSSPEQLRSVKARGARNVSVRVGNASIGDRARRDRRLRRAAETLRHDDVQGDVRARGARSPRGLGPGRAAPLGSARRRQRAARPTRIRGRRSWSATRRRRSTASSAIPRSRRRCA